MTVYTRKGYLTPGSFGAVGDGVTDDTAAVQAAIDYCSATGEALLLDGKFLCDDLTGSGDINWLGYGYCSQIIFTGSSSFSYSGGALTWPLTLVNIRDISVRSQAAHNTAPALLKFSYTRGAGDAGAQRTVNLENVEVCGTSRLNQFDCGIWFENCTALKADKLRIQGGVPILTGTVGVKIAGDGQPIDMYVTNSTAYFLDTGISCIGAGLGYGFEGLNFTGNAVLFCNYGLVVNSATVHDFVGIHNNNFNCYISDIVLSNMHNLHIIGNLLYNAQAAVPPAWWNGIQINNSDPAFTFMSNNIIANNSIFGGTTGSPPSKIGISINGYNGANTETLISANAFYVLTDGVRLFSGANNVVTGYNNVFKTVTTPYTNAGGSSNGRV